MNQIDFDHVEQAKKGFPIGHIISCPICLGVQPPILKTMVKLEYPSNSVLMLNTKQVEKLKQLMDEG